MWWPAIRTSNGHLAAPLRCTLSSSCHRIALATAPGAPTPQHRFSDPQEVGTRFQEPFSRTAPKTVFSPPLPVAGLNGAQIDPFTHTHRSTQDCTLDLRSRSLYMYRYTNTEMTDCHRTQPYPNISSIHIRYCLSLLFILRGLAQCAH